MTSHEKKAGVRLLTKNDDGQITSNSPSLDASVLAKLAEDVIAWNRPLTPSEVEEGVRPAQVAKLEGLSRGFKIRRSEEPTAESPVGALRLLRKET